MHSLRYFVRAVGTALLVLGPVSALGQGASPFVYTVGNTYEVGGKTYAYILWQPAASATTFGKRFAIYRKEGPALSPDPYARLSIQSLQTAPAALQALLKLGNQFDANGELVAARVNTLYADSTLQPAEIMDPPPTEVDMTIGAQFGTLLQIAEGDSKILQRLFMLGRAHPGVMIALGHGFAIGVPAASHHTYEVREIDHGGNDIRVVGRVSLNAASPVVLPAPGRPIAVPHEAPPEVSALVASPKDHLACRFRWATPVPLRQVMPHSFGFDLFRVKESVAVLLGWDAAAPLTGDLLQLVDACDSTDPDAKRVNCLPVIASAILNDAAAADPNDHETFFTHDDKDPPDHRFHDGETFYYYAAARDIAGHPGLISLGTRVTYCDRLPPTAPAIESISNVFASGTPDQLAALQGTQHFKLRIRQVPESPAKDAASMYLIYRWNYAEEALQKGGNPGVNLVGSVPHQAGQRFVDWEDTGAGAPMITPGDSTTWAGKKVWYTIRSEDGSACVPPNVSGHSAPAVGVLRDRAGPGRIEGEVRRCRMIPVTNSEGDHTSNRADLGIPAGAEGFIVRVIRDDPLIVSFEITVDAPPEAPPTVLDYQASHLFSVANSRDIFIRLSEANEGAVEVRCRTQTGLVSNWARTELTTPPDNAGDINIYPFTCSVHQNCEPTSMVPPTENPPVHEPIGPGGVVVGPNGTFFLPDGVKEWRLYRRIEPNGRLELIDRGSGDFPGGQQINWDDTAPVTVNETVVCYYVQVFDENGNASVLSKQDCLKFTAGNLATPMLMEPQLVDHAAGSAKIRLEWFCDPVGTKRFEICIAEDGGGDPAVSSLEISPKLGAVDGSIVSAETPDLSFSAFQTKAVDGSTAEFSAVLVVPADKLLWYAVRAVGSGDFGSRPEGSFSNVVSEFWQEPDAPGQPVVPWPDRPLSIVQNLGFDIGDYLPGEGPFFAQPLPPGSTEGSAVILVGLYDGPVEFPPDLPSTEAYMLKTMDPIDYLFRFRRHTNKYIPVVQTLDPINPFVVYRHQVPNTKFPAARPNLVQCSPLIDRMAYKTEPGHYHVRDPFFLFVTFLDNPGTLGLRIPSAGTFTRDNNFTTIVAGGGGAPRYFGGRSGMILWRDTLPAIKGASYQYLVVHFDDLGEIDRVFPTNIVNH